jgi:acyl-CoA reductase-like NAD-dependent aldehyde dehydrogenase
MQLSASPTDLLPLPAGSDGSVASWIRGEWASPAGEEIVVDDPSTGTELCRFKDGGTAAADAAISAAVENHKNGAWARMPGSDRARVLWGISHGISVRAEELARLESLMVGRPLKDTRADVAAVIRMFEHYAGWCDKIFGDVIPVPSNHVNYTQREPYGVIVQLTPWNAPVFTAGWQLAPALATGNSVVIKPSEFTPLTTLMLVQIAEEAGLPIGTVNVVLGAGHTAGEALTADPRVDKIVFLGSVATGRRVAQSAALALTPTLLELGGKSPNIVLPGVDYDIVLESAINGVMQAAGQSCTALSRVLVPASDAREFARRLAVLADALVVGPALDESTQVGPLCHQGHLARVTKTVEDGLTPETEVLTGGRADSGSGYFYRPTVVLDLDGTSPLARGEIFGPVVVVSGYHDEDHAVAAANGTDFGLAAMVWSNSVGEAHRVASRVQAGTVWINGGKALNVMSPFGGYKDSGYGRSSGADVIGEYTRTKSIWVNLS